MNGYDIILLHADLQWRHVHVHQRLSLSNTMEEPPIKDPLRKGQTLYKGHIFPKRNFRMEQTNFKLPKRTASLQGTKLLASKCPLFRASSAKLTILLCASK